MAGRPNWAHEVAEINAPHRNVSYSAILADHPAKATASGDCAHVASAWLTALVYGAANLAWPDVPHAAYS